MFWISDRTHWPVKSNNLFTLEATAYALLALVKAKEFGKAGPIINWLNEQQFFGGGYGSTQSTIMVFQAVAEYSSRVKATLSERWTKWGSLKKRKSEGTKVYCILSIHSCPQVSRTTPSSLAFRIHKVMEVGLLQPAAITVYEYLDMENRCVKFYHPVKNAGELNRLCHEDLCQCAEEGCCVKKSGVVSVADRGHSACGHGMDYVYKVTVEKTDLTHHTDVYHMKVTSVIKEGTDVGVEGKTREFIAHPNCRGQVALQEGKTYLIMGHRDDVVQVESSFKYLLGHATWLEYWPTPEEGQTPQYRDTYVSIETLAHELSSFGCTL